ncbi:hypothetical protein [Sphingosinicella terrae]|uniref:hypothetical protein n=1 Tax=Sphingosinicella terrae TaxID=2172047 RepID=UPI000E0D36B3|nr:hypothetical protein [Sphingosinicella terrae]
MTLQIDGVDMIGAIEIAAWVGSIVAMLIVGLVVYLMVRPPRRARERPMREPEPQDVEEMMRLLDRIEQRLEVLERAVETEPAGDRTLEKAGESREARRLK